MNQDPSPVAAQPAKSFFHHAATACTWLSVVPWIFGFLTASIYQRMEGNPLDVVIRLSGILFMLGIPFLVLVLGVVALCGISKYGRKGILLKALVGLTITIGWIAINLLAVQT